MHGFGVGDVRSISSSRPRVLAQMGRVTIISVYWVELEGNVGGVFTG